MKVQDLIREIEHQRDDYLQAKGLGWKNAGMFRERIRARVVAVAA
jgi:hypothetical protein